METFTTKSTSLYSQVVNEPIIIEEYETTRKVFIAEINDKKLDSGETVSGTLIHQRKGKNDTWEEIESINLNSLKGGDGVKLKLKSSQIKKLYDGLTKLYALSQQGVRLGENEYIVGTSNEIIKVPAKRKEYIETLLNENLGEEIWELLVNKKPDLATKLSNMRIFENRFKAIEEFQENIDNTTLDESYWQDFFTNNDWIFGYGLNYQFLTIETDQPNYGGENYLGRGKQKGDFLTSTSSENAQFTVLVEIKKPNSNLLAKTPQKGNPVRYRNGAWLLGSEVLGGVAQLQINCKTWQKSSDEPQNRKLIEQTVYTVQPKGLLIIGNTKEFKNNIEQITTFELFRKSINSIEIITFDELLSRAKFILGKSEEEIPQSIITDDSNDLPF